RARGDERAGVDVAGCDDAVERRVYLLEALQIEQAVHVRLIGVNGGARGIDDLLRVRHGRGPTVDLLLPLRTWSGFDVALERRPGEGQVRLELHHVGL